jgi:nicotinamidase-related amidase
MNRPANRLLDRARCCLAVIDVQAFFLDKLPAEQRAPLVARIAWLMRAARALDIPLLATAEDIPLLGSLVPELAALLPRALPVHNKVVFGLADQADIRAAAEATGRDQFVLTGLETDVCITQSAFGLMEAGHAVAVVADACASPAPHHDIGIQRLQSAGAAIMTVKSVYYDWVRDLATLARVKAKIGGDLPAGLTL